MALPALAAALLIGTVTLEGLLGEMTDLERLSRTPEPGVTCRQFSSYDRRSRAPDAAPEMSTDARGWFANGDRGNYLRVDAGPDGRRWHVLAEMDGPGAVVRIWSADPAGTVRIWLDGAAEPVIDAPFADLLGGKVAPFVAPFAGVRSAGWNLYFPIPYARSCKIATDRGGQYYHVNYRTYPKGTEVETLTRERLAGAVEAIRRVWLGPSEFATPGERSRWLLGGESIELDGPGRIEQLEIDGGRALERPLREATLAIFWDGAPEPAVLCPVGDFFGTAPGLTPYWTLPMAAARDGRASCRFPMPFRKARIELRAPSAARIRVLWRPDPAAASQLRFHARWHGRRSVPTRPLIDWPVLRVEGGPGRLVGVACTIRNPTRTWWGEGDEKISVDGESFPSTFGTGTEDYFGYAWGDPTPFQHAYHSQSRCDGPGSKGWTALNRFHVIDDIPFQRSLRFDLELWHWESCDVTFSTVAYFYAAPGARVHAEPARPDDREWIEIPPPRRVAGAQEGEALEVIERTAGATRAQELGEAWSGESHLWWTGAGPGARLRLTFRSPAAGPATLVLALTKSYDYGIARIAVNGRALEGAAAVDLHAPDVTHAGEIAFDVADLRAGENELEFEIVGTSPAASPANYMIGLDYLRLAWLR